MLPKPCFQGRFALFHQTPSILLSPTLQMKYSPFVLPSAESFLEDPAESFHSRRYNAGQRRCPFKIFRPPLPTCPNHTRATTGRLVHTTSSSVRLVTRSSHPQTCLLNAALLIALNVRSNHFLLRTLKRHHLSDNLLPCPLSSPAKAEIIDLRHCWEVRLVTTVIIHYH